MYSAASLLAVPSREQILQLALTALLPSLGAEDDARFVGHLCVEFLGEVLLEHLQPPDSFDNITACF